MELRFSPTEEDWRNVARVSSWSSWGTFQFVLTFVPLFFLGGLLGSTGYSVAGWLCMGLSIGIAFAGYEVPRILQQRLFRASPFTDGERFLNTNDEGIQAAFPLVKMQYDWRAFTRYRETEVVFVLLAASQIAIWIPKRAMSQAQITELRGVLKARLSKQLV